MSKSVAVVGKVVKYGVATGLVCWLGYESLYNSKEFISIHLSLTFCS